LRIFWLENWRKSVLRQAQHERKFNTMQKISPFALSLSKGAFGLTIIIDDFFIGMLCPTG